MRTADLTGTALDWAVATADGEDYFKLDLYAPSKLWEQGGLIIEQERISLIDQGGDYWQALCGWTETFGDTPLIAAMRCYVASKLGDEIELPEELMTHA